MHVKRVYRATVRDALAAAREQLGPGALVLSTELVPAPGWRGWLGQRVVRLTAAAERAVAAVEAVELSAGRTPVPDSRQASLQDSPQDSRPDSRRARKASARAGVVARLLATGLDRTLAEAVAARLSDAECRGGSESVLRRTLAGELTDLCAGPGAFARYEVFVGPPGVGKTSTIAKIVAQERARGGKTLGLIAADAFRAGAVEQLRTYATVFGAPFRVARTAEELGRALEALRHITLVDTAGRSVGDDSLPEIYEVLAHKRGVRTHLVMAADTSAATARRILDRYAPVKPARVVITKLDETDSAMPLVRTLRDRGLPVSYLTTGQRVPDDLLRATPVCLAAVLLREPAPEEATCR